VDAAAALAELQGLSTRIESAVVLDEAGAVLGSTHDDPAATERLAGAVADVLAAAGALRSADGEVTRVEVELAEGGLFVLREGGRTIAATTDPDAIAGIVVYDLRTCLQGIDAAKPKRPSRAKAKAKHSDGKETA
jgi:predicted regulator of Ras-like GTPase activity (Roadblock/LC7/MglB family)